MSRCPDCQKRYQTTVGRCQPCFLERKAAAAEKQNQRHLERKLFRYQQDGSSAALRLAMLTRATPKWRDTKAIAKIYKEARRLTKQTGVGHHVDHIYPVMGALCCGLHVHQNLRVMDAAENIAKSNSHPLHESPALDGLSDLEIRVFIDEMRNSPRPA